VFLELKTHHESWVGLNSNKRRVLILEKDMGRMIDLSGTTGTSEEGYDNDPLWSQELAREIVLGASPQLKGSKLDTAVNLLLECRQVVVMKQLRPCVRTMYSRITFQSIPAGSQVEPPLRLTLDENVTFVDERRGPKGASTSNWRLPDDADLDARGVARLPCAVLEVKVTGEEQDGGDLPPFVKDLLASGVLGDATKFSKCLSATAAFHYDKVSMLPYWAELPLFQSLFQDGSMGSEKENKGWELESSPGNNDPVGAGTSMSLQPGSSQPKKRTVYSRATKIEPKSYFANERTFIQWISAALLLVTVASILIEFDSASADVTSLILFILSLVVILYGLVVYLRRIFLMQTRKAYGYTDLCGPAFLSVAIMGGIGATMFQYFGQHGTSTIVLQQQALKVEPNQCVMLGLGGRSALDYQPSDIVANNAEGLLIIPSMTEITAIPMDAEDSEVRVLAEIAEADIEALTYGEGVLFAMSEANKKSELFALETIEGEENPKLIGRWKTNSVDVESMVYIPTGQKYHKYEGKLIIANEAIDVYSVPSPLYTTTAVTGSMIEPIQSINKKIICRGINENCKSGAMQFFEGHLYILHDNARVIRKWNLDSAQMLAEYPLPWVDDGFEKQWEGMALVRKDASALTLYLSLDTPAQVWSIAITEGTYNVWEIPPCAGSMQGNSSPFIRVFRMTE